MLENIGSPKDIKKLNAEELKLLCAEIREKILDTVSKNGGHLASNLGIVEATVMLHRIFSSPEDSVIFDVSHQAYAHKLLTGRYESFGTLRREGGISGFTNRGESEHDVFTFGHSGSSVSAALGIASANKLKGSGAYTIAVIGDASCSNGMVFEALNCITDKSLRLIIVLNDNGMSISKNRGKLARHFSGLRTSRKYLRLKNTTEKSLLKVPLVGRGLVSAAKSFKHLLRFMVYKDSLFQSLGLDYIGPVDGNDIEKLDAVFSEAKRRATVTVVHMRTKKGLGYPPAVKDPESYHAVSPFDPSIGIASKGGAQFSDVFGEIMMQRAVQDEKLCGVCAAMCAGTGLNNFSAKFPDRFFDAGIGEEHAITFCCGLARAGMRPVAAIYSTFLQRCYDQLVHDAALQGLPLVLAVDRAGLVPGDGATHHGVLDCAMLSCVPGAEIWSPETYEEMRFSFENAFCSKGIAAVRYPRGGGKESESSMERRGEMCISSPDKADVIIITYGRTAQNAREAAGLLEGTGVCVIKLIKVFPFDAEEILPLVKNAKLIYFLEESMECGCLSQKYAAALAQKGVRSRFVFRTLGSSFIPHGSIEYLYGMRGFLPAQIAGEIRRELRSV